MLVYIQQLGGGFAMVTPVSAVDPGFGVGAGLRPDQSLPWAPGRPGHDLPSIPGVPDNSLPTTPPPVPPQVAPGEIVVMVRGADGKWHWATLPAGSPSPKPVPPAPKG